MHSILIIFIAVCIMLSIIKKVGKAYEKRPEQDAFSGTNSNKGSASVKSFSERVRRNPTDSTVWAEWGFSLLQEALGTEKDPQSRVALIEAANNKLSTAYELNLQDYDVPHEWAVALGYACAGCDVENREKYLSKAMELARKSFEKIGRDEIYYYYDWAEMLASIAPLFPEGKRRRILGEAYAALGKADKEAVDDGDYYNLWIETCIGYALLSLGEQRILLLNEARSLYKEVPEDEKKCLSAGLEKRILDALEKAHAPDTQASSAKTADERGAAARPAAARHTVPDVRATQAQTAVPPSNQNNAPARSSRPATAATAVPQSSGKTAPQEEALSPPEYTPEATARTAEGSPAPGGEEENFALLAQQYTPPCSAGGTPLPSSPAHGGSPSGDTGSLPPEPSFVPYQPPRFSTPSFPDTLSSFPSPNLPDATPRLTENRELPGYARPKEAPEESGASPSTPAGYKPINYGKR